MKEKFNKLIKDFIVLLEYDLANLESEWFKTYYKEPYENYLQQCKNFLKNDNLKCKINKDKGCKLIKMIEEDLNLVSSRVPVSARDFDDRLNLYAIYLNEFIFSIFE